MPLLAVGMVVTKAVVTTAAVGAAAAGTAAAGAAEVDSAPSPGQVMIIDKQAPITEKVRA
jgi:hypothetical protein